MILHGHFSPSVVSKAALIVPKAPRGSPKAPQRKDAIRQGPPKAPKAPKTPKTTMDDFMWVGI